MLSYRHAFHAGNFADILKHAVLTSVLQYMQRKNKGYSYIDTHAGAGMYRLNDPKATKTGEYLEGIAKLFDKDDIPEALSEYVAYIKSLNDDSQLEVYPGSPAIARHFARRQDVAFLYDLHPADFVLLTDLFEKQRKVQIFRRDGYSALRAHLPPATRRAVVLIDPPYELKTDYQDAVSAIIKGYKLFDSATYILWYPVVQRFFVEHMEQQFINSDVRNVLQLEFSLEDDHGDHGMTGSGLFVVNPPWTLAEQAQESILPYLNKTLGSVSSSYKVKQLIAE